jgi:hypothetical protein
MASLLEEIMNCFPDEEFTIIDGFDNAVIGVQISDMRIIYSVSKCIDILTLEGIDLSDAIEHLEFNIINMYIGEKTPIWCDDMY